MTEVPESAIAAAVDEVMKRRGLTADQVVACRAFGERVAAGNLDVAARALEAAAADFDKPGVLPEHPDEAAVEAWLQGVRYVYWDRP